MASSSSSIFTGVKFSPILAPLNSRDSRRSGFIKDSRSKVRFNPAAHHRVRVEAQSLIPYNGLWYSITNFFVISIHRAKILIRKINILALLRLVSSPDNLEHVNLFLCIVCEKGRSKLRTRDVGRGILFWGRELLSHRFLRDVVSVLPVERLNQGSEEDRYQELSWTLLHFLCPGSLLLWLVSCIISHLDSIVCFLCLT